MSRSKLRALAFLTMIACITAPRAVPAQGATPSAAVEGFFKATADSDMKAMGLFFGNTKGPVATNKKAPPGTEKKLEVMAILLNGVVVKVLGETGSKDPNIRTVTTQLSRGACKVTFAVVTNHSPVGWLVNDFDFNLAQAVNRICEGGAPVGNTGG